jgi:hypothetical protein
MYRIPDHVLLLCPFLCQQFLIYLSYIANYGKVNHILINLESIRIEV